MEPSLPPNKGGSHSILRYTSMATQMAITIFLGVWGGMKLDESFQFETPVMTLICSLLGVIMAVYIVIRDVLRKR
ncbi:MAG: putative F0F1-ATPase subunit Ca2+/Mg2+ transporter [Bacteroidota bacterium]